MLKGDKEMSLKGKVALITGGGTGIGAAIAKRFVAEGAKICITGRRQAMLDKVSQSLPAGSVVTCSGDVSKQEDVKRMIETALKFDGRLDVLVNNAGLGISGSVTDIDPEEWRRVIEVDLTGPFLLMKASIPHMVKGGGGSIINIASLAGLLCLPEEPAYCAAKAGLIHLTKQVALDYGSSKVRCNVICPGAFRTDMLESGIAPLAEKLGTDLEGGFAYFAANAPLRRVANPDEISGLCNYLAGEDSSFMTGSVLTIDGGASVVDVSGIGFSSAEMKLGM
jgi:NAD(P)-dependent dehydrogenase (short-subunit alcohol dehydrogenase family)